MFRRIRRVQCPRLLSSLVPTFLNGILGVHNLALIGGAAFLIFTVAAISQAVSTGLPARRSLGLGLPLCSSVWHAGIGIIRQSALAVPRRYCCRWHRRRTHLPRWPQRDQPTGQATEPAATVSTFFVAAYLGLGLPAVLTGLISQATGTVDASVYVSVLAATFVVAAIVVVLRTFGTATAPEPSSTPSDTWCCPKDPASWGEADVSAGICVWSRRGLNSAEPPPGRPDLFAIRTPSRPGRGPGPDGDGAL